MAKSCPLELEAELGPLANDKRWSYSAWSALELLLLGFLYEETL